NVYRDTDQGQFLTVVSRRTGVTIGFNDITYLRPGVITVVDNATRAPVDPFHIDSYALNTVTSNPRRGSDVNFTAYGNLRHDFLWRVPVTLKGGLDFRQSTRDNRGST